MAIASRLLAKLLINLFGIVVLIFLNICIHNAVNFKTADCSCIVVDRDPMTKILITSFIIFGPFFIYFSALSRDFVHIFTQKYEIRNVYIGCT